jgi:HK97 family phage portal protein
MSLLDFFINRTNKISEPALIAQERTSYEQDNVSLDQWVQEIANSSNFGSTQRNIHDSTAWQIPTVYAIISIISQDLASLGHGLYDKTSQGNSIINNTHPAAILSDIPNSLMSGFTFKELMCANVLSRGNAYARIHFDSKGRPSELEYLDNNDVTIDYDYYRNKNELFYFVHGERLPLYPHEMLHYKGLTGNGIEGLSPLALLRTTVHETVRSQDLTVEFYDRGARVRNILSTPNKLSKDAYQHIKNSFNVTHMGPEADPTLILEEGLTFTPVALSPTDAQTLTQRKFNLAELCRPFRMPLPLVQEMDGATYNNVEHQTLVYSKFCLRPYAKRFETEENLKLLLPRERGIRYHKYNIDSILRADIKARSEHLKTMFMNGIMTQNEIRNLENLPSLEGGDVLMTPVTMRDKLTEPIGGKIKTNDQE